jgi:hypothetical protein
MNVLIWVYLDPWKVLHNEGANRGLHASVGRYYT